MVAQKAIHCLRPKRSVIGAAMREPTRAPMRSYISSRISTCLTLEKEEGKKNKKQRE